MTSTRILFGGSRVGHTRCRGSRPPEEVVRRRIREEDEHVNRYVFMLDTPAVYNSTWMVLHRDPSHVSIAPVMVPALWVRSAGRSAPRGLGPGKS